MAPSVRPDTEVLLLDNTDEKQRRWNLCGKTTYTIGRDQGNDLQLPFSWVSRKHAMIQVESNGRHNLIDLGSANGTLVNGGRVITPTRLQNGDRIGIGKTVLQFLQSGLAASPEATVYSDADERTVAFVQKETVTILICDIHDFTRLSEVLGDQKVSALLQIWTARVAEIIQHHGGTVDKFIGDAVMALWAGESDPMHTIQQALRAAFQIAAFTHGLKDKHPDLPWPLRIGGAINTGNAMVGNIGVDGKRDFTVIGDVVNVAFRLEAQTCKEKNLDMVIGQEAASSLTDLDRHFKAQRFILKGKSEPTVAYGCSFRELDAYLKGLPG